VIGISRWIGNFTAPKEAIAENAPFAREPIFLLRWRRALPLRFPSPNRRSNIAAKWH